MFDTTPLPIREFRIPTVGNIYLLYPLYIRIGDTGSRACSPGAFSGGFRIDTPHIDRYIYYTHLGQVLISYLYWVYKVYLSETPISRMRVQFDCIQSPVKYRIDTHIPGRYIFLTS